MVLRIRLFCLQIDYHCFWESVTSYCNVEKQFQSQVLTPLILNYAKCQTEYLTGCKQRTLMIINCKKKLLWWEGRTSIEMWITKLQHVTNSKATIGQFHPLALNSSDWQWGKHSMQVSPTIENKSIAAPMHMTSFSEANCIRNNMTSRGMYSHCSFLWAKKKFAVATFPWENVISKRQILKNAHLHHSRFTTSKCIVVRTWLWGHQS